MIHPGIIGGATVWARKSVDSDIFCEKPHVWFKIWFYLVNRVNHVSNKHFDRGECFLKYEWIREKTGASTDQIKKCIAYLRESTMISTTKKTRGTVIKVLKYDFYQTLDNYYSDVKSDISTTESTSRSTTEAPQKHHRSTTINKNDKNDKNDNSSSKKERKRSEPRKDIDFLLKGLESVLVIIDEPKTKRRQWAKHFLDSKIPEIFRRKHNREPTAQESINATIKIFQLARNSGDKFIKTNSSSLRWVYNNIGKILNSKSSEAQDVAFIS